MVTASMTTLHQKRSDMTPISAVAITVFLYGKCAEDTPSARTDPMSEPALTVVVVPQKGDIQQSGYSWCQASVTNTSTATTEI